MTGDRENMTCHEFQARMADMIGSGEDLTAHPHIQSCPTCRALLADLQTIADVARQLLPVDPPGEDLWERIELAIKQEAGTTGSH
ncbi:MAG TPA: hypothetical protein VG893_05310 [Terracidiphilus sp.]|nr:hypothetical protein [Terracidiphilus sp.]